MMRHTTQKTLAPWSFALSACLLCLMAAPALAAPGAKSGIRIQDIVVVEKNGELLVFGSLRGAFSPELLETIHSGVMVRFVFDLALLRARKLFYDAEVSSRRLHHQVQYNALKKTYTFLVERDAKSLERKMTKSRDEMIDWMRELNGVPIASAGSLSPDGRYYVRIRAQSGSLNLVFPFNHLLAFMAKKSDWSYSPTFSSKGM